VSSNSVYDRKSLRILSYYKKLKKPKKNSKVKKPKKSENSIVLFVWISVLTKRKKDGSA